MISKPVLLKALVAISIFTMFMYTWMCSDNGNLSDFTSLPRNFYRKIGMMTKRKPPSAPHPEIEQTDWQEVTGTDYFFNIYSAYHIVGRKPAEVLLIGTAKSFTHEPIFCRIYFNDDDDGDIPVEDEPLTAATGYIHIPIPPNHIQVPGSIQTMEEHFNRLYSGVFVHCPFSGNVKPEAVSILLPNQTEPSNLIRIQNRDDLRLEADQYDFKFSLCVHPIHDFNDPLLLIEWIEFYKLMGVTQITLYNVSIGPDASCVLHDLMEGSDPLIRMNVFPWHNNPLKSKKLIRSGECGQCALSAGDNDCLYRHRGISKYMAFVDLDELIMPREKIAKNYSQLIDYLDATLPEEDIGQYLFRNGFFVRYRPDDPTLLERCSGFQNDPFRYKVCRESLMMSKAWREAEFQSYSQRTKFIIKPEAVNQTGTHHAIVMEPGYSTLNVSEDVAYMRHYRYFQFGPEIQMDRVPIDFGYELVNNLASKIGYFSSKCNIPGWSA